MKKHKKQIYLFLFVSLLIVIGSFAFLFINFRKQIKLQDEILEIEKKLILTDSLTNNLLQIESDKRGFQLTNDANYLKNFYTLKVNINNNIENLKKDIIAKGDTESILQIDSLLKLRIANLDSGIVVFTSRGFNAAIEFMQLKSKKNIRDLLNQQLVLLKSDLQARLKGNVSGINKRGDQNVSDVLVLLLVFILLMVVAAYTFRKSQQKIIKNHIQFKEAQRIAKIGSWEWEIASNKLTWSAEQFRLFGENRKTFDLTYEGYLSHLSEKEQENTKALVKNALEGKSNYAVEHKIICKDGTTLMVFEQGHVLFDKDNKPIGMFGTTQDITDRKKAENEFLEVQKKFQAIFENTADGIYQSSVDGKFITANPAIARIFGYDSVDELISSITDIGAQLYVNQEDRRSMVNLLSKYDHLENFEAPLLAKNGAVVWVSESTRIVRDKKGNTLYYEGTLKDITERKRIEETLGEVQKKYRAIFDNTSVGIYQSTIDGKFIMVNPSMARIFGYNSPADLMKSVTNISTQIYADPEERKKMIELILLYDHVEDFELQVLAKNKDIIWVSANIRAVRDEKGEISYFEGLLENITERKKAEEEILQLNRELDQFANITAHDLQEPIRMVSGFLGLLEKRYNDVLDEQGKSYVFRAKDGADRMSILIRDLLEFSRSGNKAAKKEPVNLAIVMDLVKKDLSIVMADTGTTLHVPEFLPVVTGTSSALYRLFLNLISNGIKFRKKDTAPCIKLCVKELSDCYEFTLQDNGIGVAEKDQPRLFQAFQRLHRREEYPGTGLGLVTCKKIVETHGGKIWMTSELGKGTAFHFTINKIQ